MRNFGPIVWNTMLPDNLKTCKSLAEFKNRIKHTYSIVKIATYYKKTIIYIIYTIYKFVLTQTNILKLAQTHKPTYSSHTMPHSFTYDYPLFP